MNKLECAVSAPGKVLLTGGFLVLDRKHTGLVFGLNARIHVYIKALPTTQGVTLQEFIVQSPQFKHATWRYGYHAVAEGGGVKATQLKDASSIGSQPNPFLETALSYALSYMSTLIKPCVFDPAMITILADNDYYSQPAASIPQSLTVTDIRFNDFGVPLENAHKTGLGSSAALVTAFVGAVLTHYLPQGAFSLEQEKGKRILHNLSQAAHSAAQGKIGSGFDVASAVFSSCVYRRFSPTHLESIPDSGLPGFADKLKAGIEELPPAGFWDTETLKSKVTVPKGLRLVMCDVDCGSKTPGMVKQVLAWRKANPAEADELWSKLQGKNDELSNELVRLENASSSDYRRLAAIIQELRQYVRTMSRLSHVPIEPQAQTELLDACTKFAGVIGGVIPGAGGYDAVALLIEDKPEVFEGLSDLLSRWKFNVHDPGVQSTGRVRLLGVREEMEGVRAEPAAAYAGWVR